MENHMTVTFDAISENEAFARMVVSAFMVGANPTVGEMDDVKTAVSEAVTNAVIHGYDKKTGNVMMRCSMKENLLTICVQDFGKGILDIKKGKGTLLYDQTGTGAVGHGFCFHGNLMDSVDVMSVLGVGTTVTMTKCLQDQV